MFGRRQSRTHTDQLLDELAQSYGHLKLAAGHAAGGAAEKLTPPYDKARNAASRGWSSTRDAFAPMYGQMKDGAANARKGADVSHKRNRTWPMLATLLAAGAAVGAAGAMIAKRRRATQEWDEFEPEPVLDEPGYGLEEPRHAAAEPAKDKASSAATTAGKKASAGAAEVASGVSTQAGKLADAMTEKSAREPSEKVPGSTTGDAAETARRVGDRSGEGTDKARETGADAPDPTSDLKRT